MTCAAYARIGEEDVKPTVGLYDFFCYCLDCVFICCIKVSGMYLAGWVQAVDLALMLFKVLVIVVADVYAFGPVGRKEMAGCATYAKGRVCAFNVSGPIYSKYERGVHTSDYDDFIFDSSTMQDTVSS